MALSALNLSWRISHFKDEWKGIIAHDDFDVALILAIIRVRALRLSAYNHAWSIKNNQHFLQADYFCTT